MIELVIPGECVPKGRPRFTKAGHAYTPKKTRAYEAKLKLYFRRAVKEPMEGPLSVTLVIGRPFLKSFTKKKTAEALNLDLWPISRPDLDNYVKAVLDAGNGILFADDSQVCRLHVVKVYSPVVGIALRLQEIELSTQELELINKLREVDS
ncbi:MAG: RusA family crossover junction endodeoxyribonuclease [Aerococcus sanguinicola]|uniref:RusA family crossover junction endodeoxyribonuclease n=1 Tax=Aerococcus sp. HMSC062A02 TaxID=1715105 RepID=UPI0008A40C0A|nr:RusA family crossover junction endodeoxyribonuclease [Aerococcus sp. HMSC062A02]OFN02609.1 hypothetical protein HMPREF2626_01475 [Aerococcus sp. HMSC062A02]